MKIKRIPLLFLTVVVLFGGACDDDDQQMSSKLVIEDREIRLRSAFVGFRKKPHTDVNGNTYYVHFLSFSNLPNRWTSDFNTMWDIQRKRHSSLNFEITSSSPNGFNDGVHPLVGASADSVAGQVRNGGLLLDYNASVSDPLKYKGRYYFLLSGTGTVSVKDGLCFFNFSGTAAGSTSSLSHKVEEFTISYKGPVYRMVVVE